MKIKLECSHADYHGLSDALDKTRAGAVLVKVSRAALASLLRDHGKLIREHKHELEGIL